MIASSVKDRFWQKIIVKGKDDCWEWSAALNACGYGWMWTGSRAKPAHRVSAMMHGLIDSLDSKLHVLHKCDNRKCCNPKHLFVGTNNDNVADRVSKNRSGWAVHLGEKNGMAKLTNKQVGQIRGLYFSSRFSQSNLAKMYGVQQPHISKIVNNVRRGGVL